MSTDREEFKARRTAWKSKHHEQRLTRCRYWTCTNPSVDPGARILLCEHHLILAVELVGHS